eukprot:PhM_4_TR16759/c0_g1_i1/m.26601
MGQHELCPMPHPARPRRLPHHLPPQRVRRRRSALNDPQVRVQAEREQRVAQHRQPARRHGADAEGQRLRRVVVVVRPAHMGLHERVDAERVVWHSARYDVLPPLRHDARRLQPVWSRRAHHAQLHAAGAPACAHHAPRRRRGLVGHQRGAAGARGRPSRRKQNGVQLVLVGQRVRSLRPQRLPDQPGLRGGTLVDDARAIHHQYAQPSCERRVVGPARLQDRVYNGRDVAVRRDRWWRALPRDVRRRSHTALRHAAQQRHRHHHHHDAHRKYRRYEVRRHVCAVRQRERLRAHVRRDVDPRHHRRVARVVAGCVAPRLLHKRQPAHRRVSRRRR